MRLTRWCLALPAVVAAAVVFVPSGVATRTDPAPQPAQVGGPAKQPGVSDEIIQEFPGADGAKTAWKVRYAVGRPRPGMLITGAWFKTGPNEEWFSVLGEVRLSEIFVPYNNGTTRIYDIGAQGGYSVLEHTAADAGANGQLLHNGLVVKEVRDTGILWKYYDQVRRGQELVLWSTFSASNYNYLVEYSFRCDGSMQFRLGSTGKNYGNHELMGHMHHGCWRIDLNVGDKDHNSVAVVRRNEIKAGKGKAEDIVTHLDTEGGVEWKAEEFTRLRVESKQKNAQGKHVSYEFVPQRFGTGRHFGPNEEFTAYDFWVTPYKVDETYYGLLPKYVKQGRSIKDTNVVVWYMSPAYHLPRDEDGVFINPKGNAQVRGVAMTTWCGVELRPRNLFDKSPLYP
jgi:Cu2+-containing amine oxidase